MHLTWFNDSLVQPKLICSIHDQHLMNINLNLDEIKVQWNFSNYIVICSYQLFLVTANYIPPFTLFWTISQNVCIISAVFSFNRDKKVCNSPFTKQTIGEENFKSPHLKLNFTRVWTRQRSDRLSRVDNDTRARAVMKVTDLYRMD